MKTSCFQQFLGPFWISIGEWKKSKCLRVQMQCFSCESLSQLKMYLAPCQAFMIELFGENSYHLIAVNYICKKAPPQMFERVPSTLQTRLHRSSPLGVFLRKGALKICSKFTGKHPCQSVISIKLLCNFIEITLWHEMFFWKFVAYF